MNFSLQKHYKTLTFILKLLKKKNQKDAKQSNFFTKAQHNTLKDLKKKNSRI